MFLDIDPYGSIETALAIILLVVDGYLIYQFIVSKIKKPG